MHNEAGTNYLHKKLGARHKVNEERQKRETNQQATDQHRQEKGQKKKVEFKSVGEVRGGKCDAEMKESLTTGFMTASVIAYSL